MIPPNRPMTEGDLISPALPGGSLIRALLDRRLMALADLGGASGQVGARWSDIVSGHLDSIVGNDVPIPGGGRYRVDRVIRLDALPHVAQAASKRGLQNPDYVLLGHVGEDAILQAADAKFSIETARSKQVSVEMLSALSDVGGRYTELLGEWHHRGTIVPGVFIAPQSPMSDYVLSGGRGITRATVNRDEIILLPATAVELTDRVAGSAVRKRLAELDGLADAATRDLLAGLYYIRLSSAAGASWFDIHRPLFGRGDLEAPDFDAVAADVDRRTARHRSAYDLISAWADEAEAVRAKRAMVTQAANVPLANRELRAWLETDAERLAVSPPSLNKVRKELQRWIEARILDDLGPVDSDVVDLGSIIDRMRRIVSRSMPSVRDETTRIVAALAAASETTGRRRDEILGE